MTLHESPGDRATPSPAELERTELERTELERTELERVEAYYDLAPRATCRTEEIGPFTLFVGVDSFPFYARPRRARTEPFTADAIHAVRLRQRALGVPERLEWLHEDAPELARYADTAGLELERHPLLTRDLRAAPTARPAGLPPGVRLRPLLGPDDPDLTDAIAAVDLGFRVGGTGTGTEGAADRDAIAVGISPERLEVFRRHFARGLMRWFVAETRDGPIGGGSYHPRGDVAELTGIATVPAWRRRGLGVAIVQALAEDARARGVELAFMSATDDAVARVYERAGFGRTGTACEANAPSRGAGRARSEAEGGRQGNACKAREVHAARDSAPE